MVLRGKLRGRVGSRRDYYQSPLECILSGLPLFYVRASPAIIRGLVQCCLAERTAEEGRYPLSAHDIVK